MNTKQFKVWIAGLPDEAAIEFLDTKSYPDRWVEVPLEKFRAIVLPPEDDEAEEVDDVK